jgi:polyadenylation factor subunit 2
MSRYTSAAAVSGVGIDVGDDEDYEYTNAAGRVVERDFLRRNLSQYQTIHESLTRKFYKTNQSDRILMQPHFNSAMNIPFPPCDKLSPANGICSHFLRRGFTKPIKHQLNTAVWSADGRWLVLGTQSGDFALWEAEQLKVHKVVSVPAHKVLADGGKVQDYIPITAMAWNNHGNSLVSGDNNGLIQYSDESFRSNFVVRDAHSGAVRGLDYSPFDSKLVSCR